MQTDPSKLPEVQQATATADKLVALAGSYHVTTAEEYGAAGADLVQVNGAIARLEELRLGMTRPIDQGLKAIRAFFAGPTERLERAKNQIKRAMIAYDEEQRRIAAEAQRRAEEEARKERDRLAAIAAEAQRKADEKAAEERRQAEAARAAGDLAAAAKHEQKAERVEQRAEERVETLQTVASTIVAPVIERETPKVKGISGRRVWKFRIKDASKLPREYTMPDEKKIGGVVRAMKGDTRIDGVEVWDEPDLSASRGAA